MKKAQGISINTIIIAAIALIVLIILIAVFTGRLGIWGRGMDDTSNPECSDPNHIVSTQDCPLTQTIYGKFKGVESGQVCCKVLCSAYDNNKGGCENNRCTFTPDSAGSMNGKCAA